AKTGQRGGALLSVALGDFACVGGPRRLVVGKVDLVLVVVEKDEWTLRFWYHSRRQVRLHLLGQHRSSRGQRCRDQCAAEHGAPCYSALTAYLDLSHHCPLSFRVVITAPSTKRQRAKLLASILCEPILDVISVVYRAIGLETE